MLRLFRKLTTPDPDRVVEPEMTLEEVVDMYVHHITDFDDKPWRDVNPCALCGNRYGVNLLGYDLGMSSRGFEQHPEPLGTEITYLCDSCIQKVTQYYEAHKDEYTSST